MIQTITQSEFTSAFHHMDRGNQFSHDALLMLYDFFEECDPEMELDVIAICCDFDELHYTDIIEQYDTDIPEDLDEDESIEYIRDWLSDNTMLVGESESGTFVYQSF
jgi:hypothetical protein